MSRRSHFSPPGGKDRNAPHSFESALVVQKMSPVLRFYAVGSASVRNFTLDFFVCGMVLYSTILGGMYEGADLDTSEVATSSFGRVRQQ